MGARERPSEGMAPAAGLDKGPLTITPTVAIQQGASLASRPLPCRAVRSNARATRSF